jgi:hypothetical protein
MAAPHNKNRYGELWPQVKIKACLSELNAIKLHVIISGGWAWHFMSPVGHAELKHAHDHKDIDIFVPPENVGTVIGILMRNEFKKAPTVYDKLQNNSDFRRYEKVVRPEKGDDPLPFRVTIDFFVRKDIEPIEINGWKVVNPKQLLSFYSDIHSSDNCFAVKAASNLLARGISPIGREELMQIPKE